MSDHRDIKSFEEFWPFYVKEHSKKATRILHFIGTTAAGACLVGGLVTKRRWLLAVAPVVGYGAAWTSHFFIQKNKPATFKYPLWSLRGYMVMWWKMVTRTMDAEVERVLAEERERDGAKAPETTTPETHAPTPGEAVN
jgi:hypothetical protein